MIKAALKISALTLALALATAGAQADEPKQAEVAVFLTIETQPGQRDTLVDLWEKHLKTRASSDDAHVSYVFALDMNDPNVVRIAEVYATQAAFQANTQSDWFAAYMAEVGRLLAGEPGFAMASPYWVK
ncbi:MAG: antibiotic biosynthesis monooxygenase [Pseudomonadota bacterium]